MRASVALCAAQLGRHAVAKPGQKWCGQWFGGGKWQWQWELGGVAVRGGLWQHNVYQVSQQHADCHAHSDGHAKCGVAEGQWDWFRVRQRQRAGH